MDKKIEVFTGDAGYWKEIVESTEKDIDRLEKLLKFQKAVLVMAEEQLNKAEGHYEEDAAESTG